ncbi:MAG: cadherin-like domain-containing protein, partial [Actinomycetia bacterium]|nr:cadherin-like domain-containing protein [Actinomycetes bacterium]
MAVADDSGSGAESRSESGQGSGGAESGSSLSTGSSTDNDVPSQTRISESPSASSSEASSVDDSLGEDDDSSSVSSLDSDAASLSGGGFEDSDISDDEVLGETAAEPSEDFDLTSTTTGATSIPGDAAVTAESTPAVDTGVSGAESDADGDDMVPLVIRSTRGSSGLGSGPAAAASMLTQSDDGVELSDDGFELSAAAISDEAGVGSDSGSDLEGETAADSRTVTSPAVPVAVQSDADGAVPPPEADAASGLPSSKVMQVMSASAGPLADPGPSAPAVPNPLGDLIFAFFRQLRTTFFNSSPTAAPRQEVSSLGGVVTGTVGGSDPDDDPLTYTLGEGPTRGQLTLNGDGSYIYTASEELGAAGGSDSFTVVVAEANADSHIHGVRGLLARVLSAVFPGAGINDGSWIESTVTVAIEQVGPVSEVETPMVGAAVPVDDLASDAANNESAVAIGQVNPVDTSSTSATSLAATTSTASGDDVPYVSTNGADTPRARIALSAAAPANSAPTAVDDGPFIVSQGESLTLTHEQLLGNDTDPDLVYGDALEVNWVWAPTGVVHNDAATRTVTYTPAADHLGERWFAYGAKDFVGTR